MAENYEWSKTNKPASYKMNEFKKLLSHTGIQLNDRQLAQFQQYVDLILTWNKRINLISRKEAAKVIENHVLESLAFLISFKLFTGAKIIDIGSGAGFPALPISLIGMDANFLLVESKRMKALFLKEVVTQLGLNNVEVIHNRVENLVIKKDYKEQFDWAFSRAVASLEVVYGWVEELIKPGGSYLAWKGGEVEKEIEHLWKKKKNIVIDVIKMDERLVRSAKDRVFVRIKRIASNNRGET